MYLFCVSDGKEAESYAMDLYEVKEGGVGVLKHSTPLDLKWTSHIISNLGAVSYKDGLLCWTAYDKMFCENWPQAGNSKHQIQKPAADVCKVHRGE